MRFIVSLLVALGVALGATAAFAEEPGTGAWTKVNSSLYYYEFSTDTNSKVLGLTDGPWKLCFDPNDADDGTSTATIQIRMAVGDTDTTNESTVINDLVLTGGPGATCIYEVPRGKIWVEIVVPHDGFTSFVRAEKQ